MRVWLSLVEAVAQMTNYNFSEVYGLPVMEFFAYTAYLRYKQRKEEQKIREFRLKHKIK